MRYDMINADDIYVFGGRDNYRRRINLFTGRNPRGIIK